MVVVPGELLLARQPDGPTALHDIADANDVGMARHRRVVLVEGDERTEAPGEGDERSIRTGLAAEDQHPMRMKRGPDRCMRRFVQITSQIRAYDLGPEREVQGSDLEGSESRHRRTIPPSKSRV